MEPEIANIFKGGKYLRWVKTPAKEVNLKRDLSLVIELSEIMADFRKRYSWEAVSSSNIYWPKTHKPLSVVQLPLDAGLTKYATIINPEMEADYTKPHVALEGCGSIPHLGYLILRPGKVDITGHFLDDLLKGEKSKKTITLKSRVTANCAEHEIDHLWTTLISDRGVLAGYWDKELDYVPFDKEFPPAKGEASSYFESTILVRGLHEHVFPLNHLLLVLTAEHDSSYWTIHTKDCENRYINPINQLPMIMPDTPNMRQSLTDNYSQYAHTTKPGSFSSAPMTLCGCLE